MVGRIAKFSMATLVALGAVTLPLEPSSATTVTAPLVTVTATNGEIGYTAYPSPGYFETFVSSIGTGFFSCSAGTCPVATVPGNPLSGASIYMNVNNVDSSPGWTGNNSGILEYLGGGGSFSFTLTSPVFLNGENQDNLLSGSLNGGYILGTIGGSTATIVLSANNFTSSFLSVPSNTNDYLILTGNVTTEDYNTNPISYLPAILSVGNSGGNCQASGPSCVNFINSFDLDFSASVSNTAPVAVSSVPLPSALSMFGFSIPILAIFRSRRPSTLG